MALEDLRDRLSATTTAALAKLYHDLGDWHDESIEPFLAKAMPILHGAQRTIGQLTSAHMAQEAARQLGRFIAPPPIPIEQLINLRTGVDDSEVYRRPFVQTWVALSRGDVFGDALESGMTRIREIAEFDLQQAYASAAHAALQALPVPPTAWRRVTHGTCDKCLTAAGHYPTGVFNPIHPGCRCTVEPQWGPTPDAPPGNVEQHGEVGAVLVDPKDSFAGPGQLPPLERQRQVALEVGSRQFQAGFEEQGKARLAKGEEKAEAIAKGKPPFDYAEGSPELNKIEDIVNREMAAGHSTDKVYTVNGDGQTWLPERRAQQDAIIQDLWTRQGQNTPRDGKAVMAGGLGGAGKSTVLKKVINRNDYFTINPDDVKEEMARRDMIPKVPGLSPMQASALVHEESSYISGQLADLAYAHKTNMLFDITMSSQRSVEKRIKALRVNGFQNLEAVFVDIPPDLSVDRALGRHARGQFEWFQGRGYGGRFVPPWIIRKAGEDSHGTNSHNRFVFDSLTDDFDTWTVYDTSDPSRKIEKVASGRGSGLRRPGKKKAA